MKKKSRIVLIDDHAVLRQSLRNVLNDEPDLEVVAEAQDGLQGIRVIQEETPDLVLLDIRMPKMDGTSILREIQRISPGSKVLILTMHDEEGCILDAFKSGANGYSLKTVPCDELINAIRTVLQGNLYVSPEIAGRVMTWYLSGSNRKEPQSSLDSLTGREREVLKLVAEGNSNKGIASCLFISVKTVEKHRANLMRKLDLHSVSALTSYAVEQGLTGSAFRNSAA
ncbi:MAG: response regulator transcription factor [Deltaproteobacteria bacterium]|nr:response regulator transcription factor [Deltaproteobacteria bacterium]